MVMTTTERRPRPAAHTTEIPHAARLVLAAILETLGGRRGLHAVKPLLSPSAFTQLGHFVDQLQFRGLRLHTVSTQIPHPGVIEASAVLRVGQRSLAATFRLERNHPLMPNSGNLRRLPLRAWSCTHLEVLLPPRIQMSPAPIHRGAA